MAGKYRPSKEQADALEAEVKKLESEFSVDVERQRQIAKTLARDLEKGLTHDSGSVPMIPTWIIDSPTGREKGNFIGIDLGRTIKGTNLRTCEVEFANSKGEFDITQSSFRVPEKIRTGNAEALAEFVATCLKSFREHTDTTVASHIAITFSFPVEQDYINDARLVKWLRGFDVKDAIGKDVISLMQKGLDAQGIPLKLVGVLNDSVGTLMASAYVDPGVRLGAIFGTGSSVSFFEDCGKIKKLSDKSLPTDRKMAMNCQWGELKAGYLPHTKYDGELDQGSEPGEHIFEKLFAGLYLPELLRLILIDLKNRSLIFQDSDCSKIEQPYSLDIALMRTIEGDQFGNMFDTEEHFHDSFGIKAYISELLAVRRIAKALSTRAAQMIAAGLVGLHQHLNEPSPFIIGADGSMFILYPGFRKKISEALAAILEWPSDRKEDPIQLTFAQDGNGVGAALVAAITIARAKNGDTLGIKNAQSL